MKKALLVLLLLTVVSTFTFAQTIDFGIKGGLNLSKLTYSNSPVIHNNLPGWSAGGFIDLGFHNFFIQPGLFFTTKGQVTPAQMITTNNTSITSATTTIKLNYIELPVNLLYKLHVVPGAVIYLGGGPYIAHGVSASDNFGGNTHPAAFGVNDNVALNFRDPDYGVNFIAGIQLAKKFLIDVNYGLGLANISYGDIRAENRVISISAGYLLR